MAIPKPQPKDWLKAAADELRQGDRATIKLLQQSYRHVNEILKTLPSTPDAAFGNLIYRAQLERTRKALLEEQSKLFDRLGDTVGARRLRSASRAAKLSAASDAAYLRLVGEGSLAQKLYDGATITAQRTVETILARTLLSKVPLAERIYQTSVWMNGRLDRLITQTMAAGLNAKRFAKVARDWFSPSTPGGTRYAAMRLARSEINNAFHATTLDYAASKPWVTEMEWHLSHSHPKVDVCNPIAAESPYPVAEVPRKPHPQCMCYITEKEVDEDEWIDRFIAGEFDEYLDNELGIAESPVDKGVQSATGKLIQKAKPTPEPSTPIVPAEPVKTVLTGEEALNSVPKSLFKRGSLTKEQRKSYRTYTTAWFSVINGVARRGDFDNPENVKEVYDINQIDSAMNESVIPEEVQVWRGMYTAQRLFGDSLKGDLTGFSWVDNGYGSTTADEKVVDLFNVEGEETSRFKGGNVKMRVTIPAGTKALVASTMTKGFDVNGPQAEITLQRGIQWTVVKDNGVINGVRNLEVRADPVR